MRGVLLFVLALVCSASAFVEIQKSYHDELVTKSYHDEIGIPLAEKIRAYEEGLTVEQRSGDRIVGGVIAPAGAYPYFAGLLISFWNVASNSVCGSTLLSANRLVTAAHCWSDNTKLGSQMTVRLGSNLLYFGGIPIVTNQVFTHPFYNPNNLNNDIAMIYLPTRVTFSAMIQPIDIPSPWEIWESFAGRWASTAGFGRTSDAQASASLQISHVTVQVITVDQCAQSYPFHVVESTLCTSGVGGVGLCGGDSGGPLALVYNGRPVLIGVNSFAAENACQGNHPSGYARVTSFRDFIVQHL